MRGLWRGNLLNLLRTVPFRTLNYFTYDTVHKALQRARGREGQPLSSAEQSLAGGMAGFTAVVGESGAVRRGAAPGRARRADPERAPPACYPLDVVRTLMLTQPALFRRGPVAALREVAAAGGVAGLYRGILPAFLSVVPSNAVSRGFPPSCAPFGRGGGPSPGAAAAGVRRTDRGGLRRRRPALKP